MEKDRLITVHAIANAVRISHGSAFPILTEDLALGKLSTLRDPKALREDQLAQRCDYS